MISIGQGAILPGCILLEPANYDDIKDGRTPDWSIRFKNRISIHDLLVPATSSTLTMDVHLRVRDVNFSIPIDVTVHATDVTKSPVTRKGDTGRAP